jgi:hypothetical protein
MSGGGMYSSQFFDPISLIFIDKTKLSSLSDILTHELGHAVASQLTNEEWTKYYQLRKIPGDAPRSGTTWALSPQEDFAEVYRNVFTGLRIRTYYGLLTLSHPFLETCQNNSNKSLGSSTNSYGEMLNDLKTKENALESEIKALQSGVTGAVEDKDISNTELQACRKDVLLHPEKYPTDWQRGVPYYSLADQATKDFITQIISRLN